MTEIHIENPGYGHFSAFHYAKLIIEKSKDIASRDHKITIRMDGFSEEQAKSIVGIIGFALHCNDNTKVRTLFAQPNHDDTQDVVTTHIRTIDNIDMDWNGLKSQMNVTFPTPTIPAFGLEQSLRQLQKNLFVLPSEVVTLSDEQKHALEAYSIECGNLYDARALAGNVIYPMLSAHAFDIRDNVDISIAATAAQDHFYVRVNKDMFDRVKRIEAAGKGMEL